MKQTIVAYVRVSTKVQEDSGLSIESQTQTIQNYADRSNYTIAKVYFDTHSGTDADRPGLKDALKHAKRSKCPIAVAKIDRLARNVKCAADILDTGVTVIPCDFPNADRFTIHILAAVAEHEAEQISLRTKAALQAAKRRGVKLGSARPGHWDGLEDKRQAGLVKACQAAARAHTEAFQAEYCDLFPVVKQLRDEGRTLRSIADELNQQGYTTARQKQFSAVQVGRILKNAERGV